MFAYLATGSATALAGSGAVAVWVTRSARAPRPAPATPPGRIPRLPVRAIEIGGVLAVVAAATTLVRIAFDYEIAALERVSALMLTAAAICRTYRLARAGPAVLDRLTVALALVPACALLTGGLTLIASGQFDDGRASVYPLAGVLALATGLAWRRVRTAFGGGAPT
jgi:hypothetical protein